MISVTPRWFVRLMGSEDTLPLGESLWGEAWIAVLELSEDESYTNILTKEVVIAAQRAGKYYVSAARLFENFSAALCWFPLLMLVRMARESLCSLSLF